MGRTGSVTSLDIGPEALQILRDRTVECAQKMPRGPAGRFSEIRFSADSRHIPVSQEANLEHPCCRGKSPLDHAPASRMDRACAAEIDIDTIEGRLRKKSRSGAGLPDPMMFSCFARSHVA
jgi:hypothetical protein